MKFILTLVMCSIVNGKTTCLPPFQSQIDYNDAEDIPRSMTARLADPLNFVITFAYDEKVKKFRGPLGTDIWESDFNIEDFIASARMGSADNYIKSPKRNRPKFL